MPIIENEKKTGSQFWRPPFWKWGVVVVLVVCAAMMLFWRRSADVELLPLTDSRPAWDGSYPYLTISAVQVGAEQPKFKTSLLLVKPTAHHESSVNEFQVDLHSGMFVLRQTDLFVSDVMPLSLTRTYRTWGFHARAFGEGANHPYDLCPTGTRFPYTYMDLNLEDGRPIHFRRISKGNGYADAVFGHDQTSSEFYGAQITWNGNGWTLDFRDGRRFLFPESYYAKSYSQGAPYEMRDGNGHHIELKRDKERNLKQLISPSGRTITFKYDDADRIVEATDDAGNVRRYSYDTTGHLETVANASRLLYRFEYAKLINLPGFDPYLMTAVRDGNGAVLLQNIYRQGGRVSAQKLSNGDMYRYNYLFVKNEIIETIVNGPTGKRKLFFQHGIFAREE